MKEWVPYRQLEPRVRQLTGYAYCTAVRLGHNNSVGMAVLLAGEEPYDAGRVRRDMEALEYDVTSVEPSGRWECFPWLARLPSFPWDARKWNPAWVYAMRHHWEDWRNVCIDDVLFDHRQHAWTRRLLWESDDDDDWQLLATVEQAERISRLLPQPLPHAEVRRELYEQFETLRARRNHRHGKQYRQRAAQFTPFRDQLRERARRLQAVAPVRTAVAYPYAAAVADEPVSEIRLDEPFPLLRFMYGRFEDRDNWFVANKVHLTTPAGPVTLTLTVWLAIRSLTHLAVTPFCPPEGYPLDADDTDPDRRTAKLTGPQKQWGYIRDPEAWFPASPARLWIISDREPRTDDTPGPGEELWLDLDFDDGGRYLAAPSIYRLERNHDWIYQEFVPVDRSDLAEVPALAPRWVSINMPAYPDLLKTVTARLRYLPERPRPHQTRYFET